jgi:phosphoribosylformylglycinamidine cyclo-ligase
VTDYKQSGVNIDAGNEVVRRIRALAQRTHNTAVLSDIGSFGGLFALDRVGVGDPVLVASADGVGTKLRLAFMTGVHNTIGIDLVNHCVNDILVQGARPLFFLDYLATGRLEPDVAVQIVEGLARACQDNECALLGGETAEMPGFYADGEYDVAGFIVGVVARTRLIDGRSIRAGDRLIAIPSSGLHTNGYSLARRIAFDVARLTPESYVPELGTSIGAALLIPHRSYLRPIEALLQSHTGVVKGMAHITGYREPAPDSARRPPCRRRPRGVGGVVDIRVASAHRASAGRRHVPYLQHGDWTDSRVRGAGRERGNCCALGCRRTGPVDR